MTAQRLLTAEQDCEHFGIPKVRTVRTMRQQGSAAVRLGKSYLFDPADVAAFTEAKKECPAPIAAPASTGSQSAAPYISCGISAVQSASAQRAQAIAAKMKKPSQPSLGQVIEFQDSKSRTAS